MNLETAVAPYGEADSPIRFIANEDCYEAARLLVPEFLQALAKDQPGRLVIAIPHRSLLLITDDSEDNRVLRIADIARREYESAPRNLSPALYTIDESGQCIPYTRAGRDAVANAVALSHHLLALAEYGGQKEQLEKAYEAEGTDVFVASYSVVEAKKDGHYFSYTTWAPVDSMLPRAEFIGMQLPTAGSKSCFVPWAPSGW